MLWDLADQDLVNMGLNIGSQLRYRKAKRMSQALETELKGICLCYYTLHGTMFNIL